MIKDVIKVAEEKMQKTISDLHSDLSTMKAGRANPTMLDRIQVDYYGSQCPLNQVANVSAPEPRMLVITPWEKSLLKEIEKQAAKRDLEMPVLIQVNIAKEESKHGFEVEEIDEVFNCLKDYPHVKVRGLMMMAPHIESSETEKYFKMTQELLQRLQKDYPMYQLDQLSMGMSNDYHEALNHGSTMIRIGSALFK